MLLDTEDHASVCSADRVSECHPGDASSIRVNSQDHRSNQQNCSTEKGVHTTMPSPSSRKPSVDSCTADVAAMNVTPPLPPDGGYGWVILGASFLINALVDGLCSSFGVFLPHLLDHFGSSRSKTALAGSVLAGGFTLAGPLAGGLVNHFGCRPVAMAGGFISTSGLLLSTLSPNIELFIVLYGAVGGIGLGLMYLPATVMTGFYFERRRALATGIALSGAGIGMLAIAPLSAYLLELYHWKQALWLLSCVSLNGVVMGALLRPLPISHCETNSELTDEVDEEDTEHKEATEVQETQIVTTVNEGKHVISNVCQGLLRHDSERKANYHLPHYALDSRRITYSFDLLRKEKHITYDIIPRSIEDSSDEVSIINYHNRTALSVSPLHVRVFENAKWFSGSFRNNASGHEVTGKQYSKSCHNLYDEKSNNPSCLTPHYERLNKFKQAMSKPLSRKDIFYGGSILTLKEYQSHPDMESYLTSITSLPPIDETAEETAAKQDNIMKDFIWKLFHIPLLSNRHFLVICLGSVFIQVGYFVPMVYIPDYARSFKINTSTSAILLSILDPLNPCSLHIRLNIMR